MKIQLLTFLGFFALLTSSFGQMNLSFEDWTGTAPNINPDHWASNNQFTPQLGVVGLFVNQDMSASEGSYSARLDTKTCPNCPNFGLPNPAPGFMDQHDAFSGTVEGLINHVQFDYKYIPAADTDSAYFQMSFTHWDNTADTTVIDYYTSYRINATSEWTTAKVGFIVNSNLGTPDTIDMQFFTSLGAVAGIGTDTDGSQLFIDNIQFGFTVETEELSKDALSIEVYPNPVVDYVIFEATNGDVERVEIFDVMGKVVQQASLSLGTTEVRLDQLSVGTYFYIVYANDGRQMKAGKMVKAGK